MFDKICSLKPPKNDLPNQVVQLEQSGKLLEDKEVMSRPFDGTILPKWTKMAKISYFSNEIQFSLNHILSEIFEILGVNGQMFISCGQDEPQRSPQKS